MKKQNIDNLTSLWRIAGEAAGRYKESNKFNSSIVNDSEWPNRIWFDKEITPETLKKIIELQAATSARLTIPTWNEVANTSMLFTHLGFRVKFEQVGMSMKLENKFEYEKRLLIKKVVDINEATVWERIYPHAFGYEISKEILLATMDKILYYIAYLNNEPVGTAILHRSGNIAGIHGVGVVPSARRKGFADEIMKHVLNESIEEGMEYSTLQASDMGKGIYLRLGYTEDFIITNYVVE